MPGTYAATSRVLRLQRLLSKKPRHRAAVNDLAEELGVDRRTVVRWVGVLNDALAEDETCPAIVREYDEQGRAWLRLAMAESPLVGLGVYQMASVTLALRAVAGRKGHLLSDSGLDALDRGSHGEWERTFQQGFYAVAYDPRRLRERDTSMDLLLRAVVRRHCVQLARRGREIVCEPWTLLLYRESVYVYGRDRESGEMRTWGLRSMEGIELLGERFERPADYDPVQVFGDGFGIWTGLPREEVILEFTPRVGAAVQHRDLRRAVWTGDDQGGGTLRWDVGISPELVTWILGWGSEVVVRSPARLRSMVVDALRQALDAYA